MNYPEYVEIDNKKYKINTDFRTAIECIRISEDDSISPFERPLAIIYLLFGEEGINAKKHYNELLELGKKFLSCGQEYVETNNEPDMDFYQDMPFIEASFMSDYHIWLPDVKMHWWKFYYLMSGLSNSELGNCCVLNNIRNLRNYDESKIKDAKERQKIHEAKLRVALKKNSPENNLSKEQEESMNNLNKILGI